MPGRDGTGPAGLGNYGGSKGSPIRTGRESYCECPKCGTKVKHDRGVPCSDKKCPKCGATMIRV